MVDAGLPLWVDGLRGTVTPAQQRHDSGRQLLGGSRSHRLDQLHESEDAVNHTVCRQFGDHNVIKYQRKVLQGLLALQILHRE